MTPGYILEGPYFQNVYVLVIHEYIGGYMFHYMNKQAESERSESEQTLRSILDVTNPWYN